MKRSELRQIIREEINFYFSEKENLIVEKGKIKFGSHVYSHYKVNNQDVYLGSEGILGKDDELLDWETLRLVIGFEKKIG